MGGPGDELDAGVRGGGCQLGICGPEHWLAGAFVRLLDIISEKSDRFNGE